MTKIRYSLGGIAKCFGQIFKEVISVFIYDTFKSLNAPHMIYYKQTILNKIKSASTDTEIETVINNSIHRLKMKNVHGHIVQRFILGMVQVLHREKTEQLSVKTLQSMDLAIDLFRKLQRP
jgi:hypothetical protein